MRDPKQILDSFRTDVSSRNMYTDLLRQFDLDEPNHRKPNRKRSSLSRSPLKGTAAVLSLCLVTGLTAGIGTASAESEVVPDHVPVDQPVQKPKIKIEQPKKDLRREEAPPLEQSPRENLTNNPKVVEKPKVEKVQEREKEKKKIEPVLVEKPKETTQSIEPQTPNSPIKSDHPKSPQPVEQAPVDVTVPKEASSSVPREQTKTNIPSYTVKESTIKDSITKESTTKDSKASPVHKSVSSKNDSSTPLLVAEAGKKVSPEVNKQGEPKTVEGGELPKTAGDDLNGVLIGSGMALLGSLYALRRRKEKRS